MADVHVKDSESYVVMHRTQMAKAAEQLRALIEKHGAPRALRYLLAEIDSILSGGVHW